MTGKVTVGGIAAEPLEPELRRLTGATVWVAGTPGAGKPNATFGVTRYDIVSIGGAKPLVGRVVARDGGAWLATDRDTVKLLSAPSELAARAGAKIWVIGHRAGNELTTQSYGVIREP